MARPIFPAVRLLTSYRDVIVQFTWRELAKRYKESYFGFFWALLQPLLMLAAYSLGFLLLLGPSRAPGESRFFFVFMIFAGLLPYQFFTEIVANSPTLLRNRPQFVKKTVFPVEIFPLTLVGSCLLHNAIGWALLLSWMAAATGSLPVSVLWLPVVLAPLLLLTLGLSWFLSAAGVYLGDLHSLIGVILQLIFFVTPVMYPLSVVPSSLRPLLEWNPLTVVIEGCRSVLLRGQPPPWLPLAGAAAFGAAVAWAGLRSFLRAKKGFADVL